MADKDDFIGLGGFMKNVPFPECWEELGIIPIDFSPVAPLRPGTHARIADTGIVYEVVKDDDFFWIVFRSVGTEGPLMPGVRAYKVAADYLDIIHLISLCMYTQR